MPHQSSTIQGIVLKRTNVGETDRVVTVLSQEDGKQAYIVKGARSPKSSRMAVFEPGNYVRFQRIERPNWPIVTQASIVSDTAQARESLAGVRRLTLILEMFDRLFVAEELEDSLFSHILAVRKAVISPQLQNIEVRRRLLKLLTMLGFSDEEDSGESVSDLVEKITEKPLKSHQYLLVK